MLEPMKSAPLAPLVPEADLEGARGDFLEAVRRGHERYGKLFRLKFGRTEMYIVCHPEFAYDVLVKRKDSFAKLGAGKAKTGLARVLGSGLLTNTDTESWFAQRRIVQPFFHKNRVARWGELCVRKTESLINNWHDSEQLVVDIADAMMCLVRTIMMQIVFSLEPSSNVTIDVPLSLATNSAKQLREVNAVLDEQVYSLIERRRHDREGGKQFEDVLELLLNAQDADTGKGMSDVQIRDELLTLFAAGHETTANALAWTLYALANAPNEAEKLRDELGNVLAKRAPAVKDLAQLPYTKAVFQEGLRLYPTIPSAPRVALRSCELGGYAVPEGTKIFVSIYAIHRHPAFWSKRNSFYPERFLRGAALQRAYMPFGLGQRVCIGQNLALLIGQLVLATLVPHLALERLPDQAVQPKVSISLGTRYGMKMRLKWLTHDNPQS